jgi:signal transduction histidine kinase
VGPPDSDWLKEGLWATEAQLFAAARHEALNRLELCQMNLSLLDRTLGKSESRDRQRIDAVSGDLRALQTVLARAPLRQRRSPGKRARFQLSKVFDEAAAAIGGPLGEPGIRLDAKGAALVLDADPYVIRMVLIHLLLNSLAAFRRVRKPSDHEIRLAGTQSGVNAYRLLYSDDGPGLDGKALGVAPGASDRDLEEHAFRVGTSSSDAPGLGLPLTRELLATIGGTIALVPSSSGTTFQIELEAPAR